MATDPLFETLFRPTTPRGRDEAAPAADRPAAAGTTPDRQGPPRDVPPTAEHATTAPTTTTAAPSATATPSFDTALATSLASAAPVRETGTRTRAGNAMQRTRAALLDGAHRAVEQSGTKITMSQVAAAGGVAKATLYNHFRTREAVLTSLLEAEVARLCELGEQVAAERGVAAALATVAEHLAAHPLTRALARLEPATLASLARMDLQAPVWRAAHDRLEAVLAIESRAGAITVLRWLASYLVSPADAAEVAADLAVVITGLPDRVAPTNAAADAGTSQSRTA